MSYFRKFIAIFPNFLFFLNFFFKYFDSRKEIDNCSYKKKTFKAGYNSVFHAPFFTEKITWFLDKEIIPGFIDTYLNSNSDKVKLKLINLLFF